MENCTEPTRAERHLRINEAVSGLDNILSDLDALISRINGHNEPEVASDKCGDPSPSLNQVLTDSADIIMAKRDQMQVKINEISSLIF